MALESNEWSSGVVIGAGGAKKGGYQANEEAQESPLIRFFREWLRPGGTVYLAHDIRRMCMMKFIGMLPGRYEIENVVKTLRGDGDVFRVIVHALHLRE